MARTATNTPCFCCRRLGGRDARVRIDVDSKTIADERTALCEKCIADRYSVLIVAERVTK